MKRFCLLIVMCSIIVSGCATQSGTKVDKETMMNNGLVAYYPFNGSANDESGNGNNGTVYGGALLTTDRFGNPNSAYAFDGIDDGIFVSKSSSLTFANFLRGYSISAWIKPSQKSNAASDYYSDIVSKNFAVFSMRLNNVRSGVESTHCETDGKCSMQNPFSINFDGNRWYHVVTTWDGRTGNWIVYLDGLAGPASSLSDLRPYRKTGEIDGPITIGRDGWYDRWFFKGAIDDIRIYNRAISESEVRQLHIAPN